MLANLILRRSSQHPETNALFHHYVIQISLIFYKIYVNCYVLNF